MSIDVKYINAFLESTKAVFDTMLKIPVTFEKPRVDSVQSPYDVSGVIGLSGDVVGSVVVGFRRHSAEQIVCALAGASLEFNTPGFADAIGELTNMIAGGAKSKFDGCSVSIGCPSVVTAPDHHVSPPSKAASIYIPCNTPGGSFVIEVAFRSSDEPAATTSAREQEDTARSSANVSA